MRKKAKTNMKKGKRIAISVSTIIAILLIAASIIAAVVINISKTKTKEVSSTQNIKIISPQSEIMTQKRKQVVNIEKIVEENSKTVLTQKIEKQETDVEYTTQYRNNSLLPKGKIQVLQEGVDGKQEVTIKNTYQGETLVSSEQVSSQVTKASIDKIVQIGTASYASTYIPKPGDNLYVTSLTLVIRVEPDENAEKLITIYKNEQVTMKEKQEEWYKVNYQNYEGWAKADCLAYQNPNGNGDGDENNPQYTKEQLLAQGVGYAMALNKPSGLSLNQFKKVLENDENDKNRVFTENAEYFYYVEQQYGVNGLFVAAVGIHESAWGTSDMAKNKKNLFGYGAYDSNPSDNAYIFGSYAEGIDLLARVFMKYYLNPAGTKIYGNETASGSHYVSPTLTGVNQSYASDKNWANAVYKWMMYLYNKV